MSVNLSIIIPAYQAEAFLEACVKSIVTATETDYELLLIDDGSTDGTAALCDRLAQSYQTIKVFHTENQGLPKARNVGLDHAVGRYIGFADADDVVYPHMYDRLVAAMEEDVQMTACRFRRCSADEVGRAAASTDEAETLEQAAVAERILKGCYGPFVWNKLYRRDVLERERIRFDPLTQGAEDLFFNVRYLAVCQKAVFLRDALYDYIMRPTSIMNSFRNRRVVKSAYVSMPRGWRFASESTETMAKEVSQWAKARAVMFYDAVLRELECPDPAYIEETRDYVKRNKGCLLRYRWGIKFYLSALLLGMGYKPWASVFRRGLSKSCRKGAEA